ncbi:hypothetical protein Fmac_027433 [Flemingia macrophylla]|uniref:CASP-like protein n=1 Tax=Flemingia macrophylla TaxID=520843 RepID=A0ABD1LHP6_9FABA
MKDTFDLAIDSVTLVVASMRSFSSSFFHDALSHLHTFWKTSRKVTHPYSSLNQQKMSTTIDVPETSKVPKAKAVLVAPPRPGGWKKGVAIMDFILRLGAIAAALGAAATMGTSDQTLPFFTQFFQFEASYDSFTTFQYVTLKTLFSMPFH